MMRCVLWRPKGKQNSTEVLNVHVQALQSAHGNFTGMETTNTHRTFELLYICKTVSVLVKAACRLNLASAYRVPFSAETCQARAPSSCQECAGELGTRPGGGEHRGILCARSPRLAHPPGARPRKREPPWAAGHWGSFLRGRHVAKRVSGFDYTPIFPVQKSWWLGEHGLCTPTCDQRYPSLHLADLIKNEEQS